MHFYHLSLNTIMKMPIYMFWELSQNVSRIMAEEDLRMCSIVCSVMGGADKLVQGLLRERGDVIVREDDGFAGFDKGEFTRLKALMGG